VCVHMPMSVHDACAGDRMHFCVSSVCVCECICMYVARADAWNRRLRKGLCVDACACERVYLLECSSCMLVCVVRGTEELWRGTHPTVRACVRASCKTPLRPHRCSLTPQCACVRASCKTPLRPCRCSLTPQCARACMPPAKRPCGHTGAA